MAGDALMARGRKASKQHLKTPRAALTRKPRVLWANPYCMMDTSSGASISVRQILLQLQRAGYEVEIVGATIFDNPRGVERMFGIWTNIQSNPAEIVTVNDGTLVHRLVKTKQLFRDQMAVRESDLLYQLYTERLDTFRPDLVFFYGGQSADFHISAEARARGIPSVAYLVNSNYVSSRWCRDVDLIITDTQATSDFYAKRVGIRPVPVGKFIDPADVIATRHQRRHVTLINPSWAKGGGIVAILALLLEGKRSDITFEIVESRGSWKEVVRAVTKQITGEARDELSNVIVTPNTSRMADIYERSRVVLGLSQWWESGSRVLAEAMLNGIPAIVSNSGGSPEMVGNGGIVVDLPPECHESPYTTLPKPDLLMPIVQLIERIWDDEIFYLHLMTKALRQGFALHRIGHSTERLIAAMKPLVDQRAGDNDPVAILQNSHKHGLVERIQPSAQPPLQHLTKIVVNPDELTKEFLNSEPLVIPAQAKTDYGKWLTLVHPGGNWILEKMADVLKSSIPGSIAISQESLRKMGENSPLQNPNGLNYYIHYNLYEKESRGLDVAWFTHIEEGIPPLRDKFFQVAGSVDYAIFNSPKYQKIVGLPDSKCSVVIPGIDEEFFSRKLILGIVGRDYGYTDRKNKSLVDFVRGLPFIEIRFTGGTMPQSDLPKFYRELDYVFTASVIEGGPMSLLEGLAAGKRSIFPKGVGLWSEYQENVITYDHGDFVGLERLLHNLYQEKTAITSIVEGCTWENFSQNHIDIFDSLRGSGKLSGT